MSYRPDVKNENSVTENTPLLFTPVQYVVMSNEEIGSCTIHEAISRNLLILRNCAFEPLFEKDDYSTLLSKIRHAIGDPTLQAELVQNWNSEDNAHEPSQEAEAFLNHFKHACLYIELARAAEEQKEHTRAWAFNNYASLMVGETSEKSETILYHIEIRHHSKQNSKNAQGGSNNLIPVKEEAARLLEEMKPEGGWPSYRRAAIVLEAPMAEYISHNRIRGLTASNIRNLLEKTWMPKDKIVNDAWLKNKRA